MKRYDCNESNTDPRGRLRGQAWSVALLIAGANALGPLHASALCAQEYPAKPIRMLVGYPAGGGTDVTARLLAVKLAEDLRQPVVVENRPGASGSIAIEQMSRASPDGYVVLMIASSSVLQSVLRPKVLRSDLERDLAPVSLVTIQPFVLLVHPSVPARNVKELIALARSQPGKLNYGSSGIGGGTHLAGEFFNLMAGVKLVHVPYKGGSESVVAAAAGQVDINFASTTSALPLLKSGRLRPLAVTSTKRASLMPSIPTVAESALPGYDHSVWYGVLAPSGVPRDIVTRLNTAIRKAVDLLQTKEALKAQGLEPQTTTPEQFAALIRTEMVQNAKLIKVADLKAE